MGKKKELKKKERLRKRGNKYAKKERKSKENRKRMTTDFLWSRYKKNNTSYSYS